MMKGELSNQGSSEVWVHSDVIFQEIRKPTILRMFRTSWRIRPGVSKWLWDVAYNVRVIAVFTKNVGATKAKTPDSVHSVMFFDTMAEAIRESVSSPWVVEMVVNDRLYCTEGVVPRHPAARYNGRR
jgi:hypothetical protein